MIEPPLGRTLDIVAAGAADLTDPWWLIGSAAARLIGLEGPVADVDLLTSRCDAERLLRRWAMAPLTPAPSPLFRSELFARHSRSPMPIELMAGLRVRGAPLVPATRVAITWRTKILFVPDRNEQIGICLRFGRPKDLERARKLQELRPA